MKNPLRKIQGLADWLDDRKASRDSRKLRDRYAPLVAEAEKNKKWTERDELLSEWGYERDLILDPVYARKSERLTAKARKYGITVPKQPTSHDAESDDWNLSIVYGFWTLSSEAEQRLRREIRDEKRAGNDEFRKWATLAFAVAGFALAFYSVRQKQPDPCPKNYYRNDSGECVFALQKAVTQPKKLPTSAVRTSPEPSAESARRPEHRLSTHKPESSEGSPDDVRIDPTTHR